MNTKAELALMPTDNGLGGSLRFRNAGLRLGMRLKKLRRERHLVERAIIALTEISRTRELRGRRASRN